MKKYFTAILITLVLLFVSAGCADGKKESAETDTSETSAEAETENQSEYDKILSGDLSDFEGIWKNGENETITLKADGTTGDEFTEDGITYLEVAGNFTKQAEGWYTWGVWFENYDGPSGYDVWLFPVGVDVVVGGETVQTDTTKVRLYAGHDFYSADEMGRKVYYLD